MRQRGAVFPALLALISAGGAAAQESAAPARVVDTVEIDPRVFGAAFGGVSGMDYDRRTRRWVLLSDDRSDHAPSRFYTVQIARDARGWRLRGARQVALRNREGARFPKAEIGVEAVDPEAIRVAPNGRSLIWASEGDAKDGYGPTIRRIDRRGQVIAQIPLPANLRLDPAGARGTRDNGTIEGLAFTPDGALWLAMEMPLVEDGLPANDDQSAPVRFTRLRDGVPAQQFAYQPDTVVAAARGRDGDNGVTEILAIDAWRILVLERSGAKHADGTYRFHCRLYLADFTVATDVAAVNSLRGATLTPATKRLLLDFDRLPSNPGNLEAMTWWPVGARDHLLIANDNNFVAGDSTRLLLLSLPAWLRTP